MSNVDNLSQAIAASDKIDTATKEMLQTFLEMNRTGPEQLGPALGAAFFRTLNEQGPAPAFDLVAQSLTQDQLIALLTATGAEMAALADEQAARAAAVRQFTSSLAETALTLLIRTLIAAL